MWSQSLGMVTQYGSIHKCPRSVPTPPSLWHGTLRVIHGSHSPWRCRATKPFQRIVHHVPLPRWVGLVGLGWVGMDWTGLGDDDVGCGPFAALPPHVFRTERPPARSHVVRSLSLVGAVALHPHNQTTHQPANHSSHTHKKNQTNDDQQLGRFPTP